MREFQPGDKVLVLGGYRNLELVREDVVKKFYKNGNFVLEGCGQQYSRTGFQTSSSHSYYNLRVIHADTDNARSLVLAHRIRSLAEEIGEQVTFLRNGPECAIDGLEQALAILKNCTQQDT